MNNVPPPELRSRSVQIRLTPASTDQAGNLRRDGSKACRCRAVLSVQLRTDSEDISGADSPVSYVPIDDHAQIWILNAPGQSSSELNELSATHGIGEVFVLEIMAEGSGSGVAEEDAVWSGDCVKVVPWPLGAPPPVIALNPNLGDL